MRDGKMEKRRRECRMMLEVLWQCSGIYHRRINAVRHNVSLRLCLYRIGSDYAGLNKRLLSECFENKILQDSLE